MIIKSRQLRSNARSFAPVTTIWVVAGALLALALGAAAPNMGAFPIGVLALMTLGLVALAVKGDSLRTTPLQLLVAIAFFSLGLVFREPAPVDLLVPLALGTAVLTSSFHLSRDMVTRTFVILLGVLVGIQYVSLLSNSSDAYIQFANITTLLVGLCVLVFVVTATDDKMTRIVIASLVVGASVTTALAILIRDGTISLGIDVMYDHLRFQGFFKDPNVLAPFLVVPFLLVLANPWRFHWRHNALGALTLFFALSVFGFGIYAAFSRGGWVNLLVSVAVLLGVRGIESKKLNASRLILLALLLTVALSGVSSLDLEQGSFLAERARLQTYDVDRFTTQREAFEHSLDTPILGNGPGTADTELDRATHSLPIRMLFESGFVGLLSMTGLIVGATILSLRAAFHGRTAFQRRVAAAVFAALVGATVNGLVIDTLHWRHLWILIGLGWASAYWLDRSAVSGTPPERHRGSTGVQTPTVGLATLREGSQS